MLSGGHYGRYAGGHHDIWSGRSSGRPLFLEGQTTLGILRDYQIFLEPGLRE